MMKTAFLYDDVFLEHETGEGHPERAERLRTMLRRLEAGGYMDKVLPVPTRAADERHLELIHKKAYIERVKQGIESGEEFFDSVDNTVCTRTYHVALSAVGGCLNMCDAVMSGRVANGFCAVRPPGHHAESQKAGGFCFFNNVAIAARYIQTEYGVGRVAIVDWDVHHGNGTQDAFQDDDSVYYISLHQYPYYPGTGAETDIGFGQGLGYTLNIPVKAGSGNSHYLQAFNERVVPELERFRPEVVLVSAGFDAHRDDPLSSINLTGDMYYRFTRMLRDVARRHASDRLIAFLEGGYNVDVCAEGAEQVIRALLEE
jgi:acetoin utilization deacetylase AcuC-like enzyme